MSTTPVDLTLTADDTPALDALDRVASDAGWPLGYVVRDPADLPALAEMQQRSRTRAANGDSRD